MNGPGVVVMSKGMQRLLRWIAFSCALNALVFVVAAEHHGPSNAYTSVFETFPLWAIVAGWVATGLAAVMVLVGAVNASVRYFVLASYSLLQVLFAWSIFTLTFDGFETALVGTSQWAGYIYFSVASLLDRPHEPRKLVD